MLQINMWIDHRTTRLCVGQPPPGSRPGPRPTPQSVVAHPLLNGFIIGYNGPKEAPMYFEQFYLGCLSHASYMAGSEGVAAGIDPQRDVEIYLDAARRTGLGIEHVIETHLHADFGSGHRELAARTGAK